MRRRRIWRSSVIEGPTVALLEHCKRLPSLLLGMPRGECERRVRDLRKAVENSEYGELPHETRRFRAKGRLPRAFPFVSRMSTRYNKV